MKIILSSPRYSRSRASHRSAPVVMALLLLGCLAIPFAEAAESAVSLTRKTGSESDSGARLALVIANSAYETAPLVHPVKNAGAVAEALRDLGFTVMEKKDLNQEEMKKALDAFGQKLEKGGVGLFYYSGHGLQVNGENYLVPVNARIPLESDVKYRAVTAGLALAKMRDAKIRVGLMILDACGENPFKRAFTSSRPGLAPMDAPMGTLIAYAAAPDSVAGDSGLFANELAANIKTRGLSIAQVFTNVRKTVSARNPGQTPEVTSRLSGDYYLNGEPNSSLPGQGDSSLPREYTEPATGMEFVLVKGGCYLMGDAFGEGYEDEKPAHEVCVKDLYMGKYEVTQGQWSVLMGRNPSGFSNCGENCPVENVSWDDSQEYIGKLNGQSGKTYRLPTEAEWEYAAREGGRKVRFGTGNNVISAELANINASENVAEPYSKAGEYRGKTLPVGSFKPNALGLYDMTGNVLEWCGDWYDENYYGKNEKNDPQGQSFGNSRILRGGSWNNPPKLARASARLRNAPDYGFNFVGVRIVRDR